MMTSSNGNIFRVTGHSCGKFTGPRWISRTKASDAELWCSFDMRPNIRLSKQSWGWWFETPPQSLWRHCNDLVPHSTAFIHIYANFYVAFVGNERGKPKYKHGLVGHYRSPITVVLHLTHRAGWHIYASLDKCVIGIDIGLSLLWGQRNIWSRAGLLLTPIENQ